MKICLIGNSHLGAIKRGFDILAPKNVEATFFAYGGKGMAALEAKGGSLVAGNKRLASGLKFTSGGHGSIIPESYDVIVIYGLGFYAWFPLETSGYTKDVISLACKENFINSLSGYILSQVRSSISNLENPPLIIISPSPFPSKGVPSGHGVVSRHSNLAIRHYDLLFNSLECSFLYPPLATLEGIEFTGETFSKGSQKLATGDEEDGVPHPEKDYNHMNSEYGRVWCEMLFDYLNIRN